MELTEWANAYHAEAKHFLSDIEEGRENKLLDLEKWKAGGVLMSEYYLLIE